MKKHVLTATLTIAIATLAAFNLNIEKDNNDISNLTINNIEALATGEEGDKKTL